MQVVTILRLLTNRMNQFVLLFRTCFTLFLCLAVEGWTKPKPFVVQNHPQQLGILKNNRSYEFPPPGRNHSVVDSYSPSSSPTESSSQKLLRGLDGLLVEYGGEKLSTANLYLVFMGGDPGYTTTWIFFYFLDSLMGSDYLNTLTQYVGTSLSVNALGFYYPTSTMSFQCSYQLNNVPQDISNYICGLRAATSNDVYVIMTTETRPAGCNACGWHTYMYW